MKLRTLTVTELNKYIKKIISSDPILNNVVVRGEISNIKYHSSGHVYFSLKDENSKINCIMFKEHALQLKYLASDGLKVIVKGAVSTFDRDGQYQIYVYTMEPEGLGALHLAYEQLKGKLEEEGLFESSHKLRIPFFPSKIAVVTSPTGAAIRDIISVISRRNPMVHINIYPVAVQGEHASEQIAETIDRINQQVHDLDLIILGRGGGSMEELWAFNEEIVARSIFNSKIPIISAVGHETDFTISDFVADLRAPTPSAAAELAVPDILELKTRLSQLGVRLEHIISRYMKGKSNELSQLNIERLNKEADRYIKEKLQLLDILQNQFNKNTVVYLSHLKTELIKNGSKLEALNPLSILSRGYALATNVHQQPIVKLEEINVGDHINIMLTNGSLGCRITSKKKEDNIIEQFFRE